MTGSFLWRKPSTEPGSGEAVGAILGEKTVCRDLGSAYVPHGSLEALYRRQGLDPESIAALAREVLEA